jgi:hypothetical protein
MKEMQKPKFKLPGETDEQKEIPDGCSFDFGPNCCLWMSMADAGPRQQQRQ